jgi:diguanylate cyclase (GGDEF)-like protein
MNPAIPKKIIMGFSIGFGVLIANALVDYRSFVTLTEATDSVQDGLQTRDLLKGIRSAVSASETGQRNYILTGNKDHLEASLGLLKSAESSLNGLLEAVDRDAEEVDKVRQLQSLLAARSAQFEAALDQVQQGSKAAALRVVASAQGKQILEDTDEVFAQFNESQGALFERRIAELQQSARFALVTFYIATFCGLMLLGLLYFLVYRDIAERRRAEERLRVVTTHDPLTALPNRTLLHERLSHALAKAQHYNRYLAVLFVDLDRFKNINDALGHDAGDLLLQMAAQRIADCLRSTDTMARQGGDEFVVLMDELAEPGMASGVSERILDAMGRPFNVNGQEVLITASIGISVYPDDGRALLKNADAAMSFAKEKGRNNYQFYSTQADKHSVERLSLESSLHRALERNELTLHYQPKVDIETGHITGMEALLRWQHPELGWIPPGRFIPLAEESGLILKIGRWVLRTACAQNKAWQKQGMRRLRVAVNLSPRQFWVDSLLEDVDEALRDSGLDAASLELEITESTAMHNPEQTAGILRKLKSRGTHISVDDFGTGYSSLAYLKRLPIDSIKVDRSFVEDIPRDLESAAITTAVINMAHMLRLKVVAEGVESAAQLRFLGDEGCDEMQGYLFSEARPAYEIPELVRKTLRPGVTPVFAAERRRKVS